MKSFRGKTLGRLQRIHSRLITGLLGLLLLPLAVMATPPTPALQYTFDADLGNTFAADTGVALATNGSYFANNVASTISLTNNTPGGSGYALNLVGANNGVNNYTTSGNPSKFNNVTNLTLTCWLNLQGTPTASDRLIDKTFAGTTAIGWFFGFQSAGSSATSLSLNFFANSSTANFTTTKINAANQWVFLALTFNGGASVSNVVLYTGSPSNLVSMVGAVTLAQTSLTNNTTAIRLGSSAASGSDRTPPAWLDDVRIYTNVVLSAADLEVVRNQNAPVGVIVGVSPNQTEFLAGTNVALTAVTQGLGVQTPTYQWLFNSNAIPGANSSTLTLNNIQIANSGIYGVVVSNNVGAFTNYSTKVVVVAPYNPAALTNIWSLLPPQTNVATVWLTSTINSGSISGLERSMAYNPTTGHLLVVHRSGSTATPFVNVLDALTGTSLASLDESGLINLGFNNTFHLDQLAVADDGVIYAGNMTVTAGSPNYALYSWQNEGASQAVAYAGDPGAPTYPGLRWGDTLAIRGAGTNTQILLSSADTSSNSIDNVFSLLTTVDGISFTSQAFAVTNLPGASANTGLAWAVATNAFYCKSPGAPNGSPAGTALTNQLYLVQFDAAGGFGSVKSAYTTNGVSPNLGPLGVNLSSNLLAGLQISQPGYNFINFYNIANTSNDPILLARMLLDYNTINGAFSGVGSPVFAKINGTNYLFVLDTGNGIFAYQLTGLNVIASNTNAYLSSLSLTGAGVVNVSSFVSNVLSYAVSEPYGAAPSLMVVNADLTATNALTYNGVPQGLLPSGTPSGSLALTLGSLNIVKVLVTAQDGLTTNLYIVNITEQPSLTQPHLTNTASGGILSLSWPGDHLGYRLLIQTNNLSQGVSANTNDWTTVPGTASVTSANLPINVTGPTEFYRLVYP